ncbi:MAG TPA: dienelactone hydrolase family protein [Gemmatimonadales bacterium]|nr:dienelactone hydrolase family protein [Gemmatimonadales bacterium]
MPSDSLLFVRGRVIAALLAASTLGSAACYRSAPGVAPAGGVAPGLVLLPPNYDRARAYPVLEILPPTGNTAGTLFQIYLSRVGLGRLFREPPERQLAALLPYLFPDAGPDGGPARDFLVVLANGRGSPDDYRTPAAWSRTIDRYEREVRADLRALTAQRRVDTTRLVVAGFSLGGDLAWALTLRNPGLLRGAIVMASRATYRPSSADAAALRDARFYLTMGTADDPRRRQLARAAADLLDRLGIDHQFVMIPGAGHEPAPLATFARALDFVFRRGHNSD